MSLNQRPAPSGRTIFPTPVVLKIETKIMVNVTTNAERVIEMSKVNMKADVLKEVLHDIRTSAHPINRANGIVMSFGIGPIAGKDFAIQAALALTEYRFDHPRAQDLDNMVKYVEKRLSQYAAERKQQPPTVVKLHHINVREKSTFVDLKKAAAREIFNENIGKMSYNKIVHKIAEELQLTVGNANFYVYRCFVPQISTK